MPNKAVRSGCLRAARQRSSQGAVDDPLAVRFLLDALVQRHGHVHAQGLLDTDADLGSEHAPLPVDLAEEADALLLHLGLVAAVAEGLEAARVGEDGPVPGHEGMQATEGLDALVARPHPQVVGVREEHLSPRVLDLRGQQALHRTAGSHRHEGGCLDLSMREREHAPSGLPRLLQQLIGAASRRRSCRSGTHRQWPRRTPVSPALGRPGRTRASAGCFQASGSW